MLKARLSKVEKALAAIGGGKCPVCHDWPFMSLGLGWPRPEHLTEDLHCRRCGRQAHVVRFHFPSIPGDKDVESCHQNQTA